MSNIICNNTQLRTPIVNTQPVIFSPQSNWKGGYRSEEILVGKISFYYRVNPKSKTADFMLMRRTTQIHSIDIVKLAHCTTIDEIIKALQSHFNDFVSHFSSDYKSDERTKIKSRILNKNIDHLEINGDEDNE